MVVMEHTLSPLVQEALRVVGVVMVVRVRTPYLKVLQQQKAVDLGHMVPEVEVTVDQVVVVDIMVSVALALKAMMEVTVFTTHLVIPEEEAVEQEQQVVMPTHKQVVLAGMV
jgi:hypothetical protein